MSLYKIKQHQDIARFLGRLSLPDQTIQTLTNEFGKHFEEDSPSFNFRWFQSIVTREKEGYQP